jgi:hypothetical protein
MQDGNYFNTLPTTHQCAVYFCVNTYEVTVENNNATTTVVSSWTSEYGTPTVGGALEPGGMDGTQNAVLQPPRDDIGESNNTYTIAAGTLANLQAWLIVTLSGSMNTSFSEVLGPVWANDEMVVLDQTTGLELPDGSVGKSNDFVHQRPATIERSKLREWYCVQRRNFRSGPVALANPTYCLGGNVDPVLRGNDVEEREQARTDMEVE